MVVFDWRILGYQFIAYYFTFYAIGHFIRLYDLRFTKHRTFLMGLLWLALALFWRMHTVPLPLLGITFIPDNLLTYGYRFLTAVAGGLFCIGAAQHLFQSKSTRVVEFFVIWERFLWASISFICLSDVFWASGL